MNKPAGIPSVHTACSSQPRHKRPGRLKSDNKDQGHPNLSSEAPDSLILDTPIHRQHHKSPKAFLRGQQAQPDLAPDSTGLKRPMNRSHKPVNNSLSRDRVSESILHSTVIQTAAGDSTALGFRLPWFPDYRQHRCCPAHSTVRGLI